MNEDKTSTVGRNSRNKNIMIAYHDNCIDGWTSAWIAYNALMVEIPGGEQVSITLLPMNYTESHYEALGYDMRATTYDELYIVDFSVPMNHLTDYLYQTEGLTITILDHHKTAFENYMDEDYEVQEDSYEEPACRPNLFIYLDNAKSGAGLTWHHFHSTPAPWLVRYVEDGDLWRFNLVHTKAAGKYLWSLSKNLASWDVACTDFANETHAATCIEEGEKLLAIHRAKVDTYALTAMPFMLLGKIGMFVDCPPEFVSDVGHAVCAGISDVYCVMCDLQSDATRGSVTWSLRSDKAGDVDVSAMAKELGGGGHKNAAGFELSMQETLMYFTGNRSDSEVR